jgi:signal transduction histidine kinase
MIFNSIRWRLQIWHGLILVVVLVGFGFTAYHVARDNQLRRIDEDLDRQIMTLFRPPPPPDHSRQDHEDRDWGPPMFGDRMRQWVQQADVSSITQSNSFYFILWQQDGSVLACSPGVPYQIPPPKPDWPAGFQGSKKTMGFPQPPGPPMRSSARTRGELRELFHFLPDGECALVGCSMASDLAAMHRLALWLVAAGAGVLALGLAGGWWLANRAIHPIEAISATAWKISGGDLSQRINIADTESELGRLAGVLNSTFARLEAAFAHQARFTSDASHELRTPVSVILAQTQTTLARERPGSEYRDALEACQRAAQRMRKLIESLLELARLDAGQESMKRNLFDLSRVALDCVEFVRPLAIERGIEIHSELLPVQCPGDAERIAQVITNLLTNAIHFNRDKGIVRISTRAEENTGLVVVADIGAGIPAEDLPHLFERFYRVDKSRSRTQGCTGLGLAICKAIVDAHNGSVGVHSQHGEGSTFTVRLPLK